MVHPASSILPRLESGGAVGPERNRRLNGTGGNLVKTGMLRIMLSLFAFAVAQFGGLPISFAFATN
jgi:hypothetical protein